MHRRFFLWLSLAAAAVVALRLLTFHYFTDQQTFLKYFLLADRTLAGELATHRLNDVSPLYLWLITLARLLSASPEAIRTLQIAATGAAALLCAAAARRFGGAPAATTAALAILGSRAVFLNATEFEPETLILLLHAGAFFFLLDADPPRWRVAGGALCLGASIAARPTAVLPALVLLLIVPRRRVGAYLGALAVPVAAVLLTTYALTGHATVMNPGTVLYEGMNPHAEGYEGIRPSIVNDIAGRAAGEPDALHLAFRTIVSRVEGHAAAPEEANAYWIGKAAAFARSEPWLAAQLVAKKVFFALHSYDAWDLSTMITRTASLSGAWIPFGVLVALVPWALLRRPRVPATFALCAIAVAYVGVMAAFYVTARQRNAMIPAVAILAGIGVSVLAAMPKRRMAIALVAVVAAAYLLTRSYSWQRENAYNWLAHGMSNRYEAEAGRAQRAGDAESMLVLRAHDATWLYGSDELDLTAVPRRILAGVARQRLSETSTDARRFDLALALLGAADPAADDVFRELQSRGYVPMRRFSAVRSVAYYRMLAALRRRDAAAARAHLERAAREAPAHEEVLAFEALLLGDAQARDRLLAIHDPFTARFALAYAKGWLGRRDEALTDLRALTRAIPEWIRPAAYAGAISGR